MISKDGAPRAKLAAATLPTAFGESWELEIDTLNASRIALLLTLVRVAATTVALQIEYSDDKQTWYTLLGASSGTLTTDVVTYTTSSSGSFAVEFVPLARHVRIRALGANSTTDTLACKALGSNMA